MNATKRFFKALFAWYFVVFHKKESPKKQNRSKGKRTRSNRSNHDSSVVMGCFCDLKSLLNGLDQTFTTLNRASKSGLPKTFRKHGPFVISSNGEDEGIGESHLENFGTFGLPSMLFAYYTWPDEEGHDQDRIYWAVKTTKAPYFWRNNDRAYYDAGVYLPKTDKYPELTCEYNIAVDKKHGALFPMPRYAARSHTVGSGARSTQITHTGWKYDELPLIKEGAPAREMYRTFFCLLYNMVMRRELGVNIVVTKGGAKATFIVPENQWKRFFSERLDFMENGKRRPIFHAVVAHERHLQDGTVQNVRTHYRGSRHFTWSGYKVSIVMPGKHGASQNSLDISDVSHEKEEAQGKTIQIGDVDLSGAFGHHA